ncbi:MAG: hypothetical protein JNM17_13885 [Archangium sp.]|nr:hypothetical protein [Archangium sp.]
MWFGDVVKSHADCFSALWSLAIDELSRSSRSPRPTIGIVEYQVASARIGERGRYQWNEGMPSIRLFVERAPTDLTIPDTTRASTDLFTLAHELGHYAVDRECQETTASRERVERGDASGSDALAILSEELAAWDAAEVFLGRVDCADVSGCRAARDEAVATYRAGLSALLPRHAGHLSVLTDTSPNAAARLLERVRATPPEARLKRAFELSDRVRAATMADLERRMPGARRVEVQIAFMRRVYGDRIANRFASRAAK